MLAAVLDDLDYRPAFRLVLRQTGTAAPEQLRLTIESLTRQSYPDWRLAVLTDAADEASMHCAHWSANVPPGTPTGSRRRSRRSGIRCGFDAASDAATRCRAVAMRDG